jgi:hypothetical protein
VVPQTPLLTSDVLKEENEQWPDVQQGMSLALREMRVDQVYTFLFTFHTIAVRILYIVYVSIHCSTHCLHLNRILQDNCLNCLHYIPLQYAILRCLHFTPYLRCLNSNPFAVRSLYITPHWSTLCLHGLSFTSLQYVLLMLFTLYPIAVRIVNVVYALPHCCTHCLHCLRSTPLQYALLMLFTLYPIAVRIVYIVNVLPHCSTYFLHFTPLQYALYVRCS